MKSIIKRFLWRQLKALVRKHGISLVLSTLADILSSSPKENEKELAKDIKEALEKFKATKSTVKYEYIQCNDYIDE